MSQDNESPARAISETEALMLRTVFHNYGLSPQNLVQFTETTPVAVAQFIAGFQDCLETTLWNGESGSNIKMIKVRPDKEEEVLALIDTQRSALCVRDAEWELKNFDMSKSLDVVSNLDNIAFNLRHGEAYAKADKAESALEARLGAARQAFFALRETVENHGLMRAFGQSVTRENAHRYRLTALYRIDGPEPEPRETLDFQIVSRALDDLETGAVHPRDVRFELGLAGTELNGLVRSIEQRAGVPGLEASQREIDAVEELKARFAAVQDAQTRPAPPAETTIRKKPRDPAL